MLTLSCPFTDGQYFMTMFYNLYSGTLFYEVDVHVLTNKIQRRMRFHFGCQPMWELIK